jgi:hypothetical protein
MSSRTKKYWRLYADESGESHVEELETELEMLDFMPPAKPVFVSSAIPAVDYRYLVISPEWEGDFHPAPRRQIQILLHGIVETETSDGTQVRFETGDVVLLEDTTGKGHQSRVVGDGVEILAVTLGD